MRCSNVCDGPLRKFFFFRKESGGKVGVAPRRRHVRRPLTAFLLMLAGVGALATPLPPVAKAEVSALLAKLERSGCKFNRNGSWYTSQEARAHLQGKLDYVERKAQATTAEAFIELAATSSSVSGKAYLVQCPGEPPVPSATWLAGQLAAIRQQSGAVPRTP